MNEPYCSNCGYKLTGLTDSSKCPECGRPLVEVLQRKTGAVPWGKRYTSPITLFGLPLLQIATGPDESGPRGKAKAIIAIGDQACGLIAIGGMAIGLVAFGGMALGVFSIGGMSLGLLAWGGWAVGGIAIGGGCVGVVSIGGGAAGLIAVGGGAVGWFYAAGGGAWGEAILTGYRRDQAAIDFFGEYDWFFGDGAGYTVFMYPLAWTSVVLLSLLIITGALASYAYITHKEEE